MLSLIFSQEHYQKFSPLQISNTPQEEFELVQDLNLGLVE